MSTLARIADIALNSPLAILPSKAATIAAVLGDRIGLSSDLEDFARSAPGPRMRSSAAGGRTGAGYAVSRGVAVITVVGTLVNRGGYLEAESGLTSYTSIKRQIQAAHADPAVTSILLDIDSPGGEAVGAFECADIVHAASKLRPVVAVANGMACSAAYAIAAAANKIIVTPSGLVGSIGVVMIHADHSRRLDKAGIVPTLIFAGDKKVDGNQFEPLTVNVKADIQSEIDDFYGLFLDSVGRHRPKLGGAGARATEAKTYIGAAAVRAGIADQVGTFEGVLAELGALHPIAARTKYDLTKATYGEITANAERVADVHAAGVRAGMAAVIAGRSA